MRTYEMHATAKQVQRSDGRSSVAAAAYRSGSRLVDERTGLTHDYIRKGGVEHSRIYTPDNAPDWAQDRERLWNAAETKENRSNSTTARELEVAFPSEFNAMQRREASDAIARELVRRYGVAVDVSLHEPSKDGDERNFHAHILFTTRAFDEARSDGWAKTKYRDFSNDKITTPEGEQTTKGKETIKELRAFTAETMNGIAQRDGLPVHTEHLSFAKRKIDREPTQKMGAKATEMERRGESTMRGDFNREVQAANDNRDATAELENVAELKAERAKRGMPDVSADAALRAHPHYATYAQSVAAREAELQAAREQLAGITITQRIMGKRREFLDEIEARKLNLDDAQRRLDDFTQSARAQKKGDDIEAMAARSRKEAETAAREAAEREREAEQYQRNQKEISALTDALASRTTGQRILGAISGKTAEARGRIAELAEEIKAHELKQRQDEAFLARRGRELMEEDDKRKDKKRAKGQWPNLDGGGGGGEDAEAGTGGRRGSLTEAQQQEKDRERQRIEAEEERKRWEAEIDVAKAAADSGIDGEAVEMTPEEKRAASIERFNDWASDAVEEQDNTPDDGLEYE